jgi:predicted SprT family Zn-dependent metalloprotease
VRRLALFLVSLACLGAALGRAGYADSRGTLHQADLQRLYGDVNRASFGGKLPEVPVRFGDLTKDDAYGVTHFEKDVPYAMEIDRQSVQTESFARDVIRHEGCHIATIREAKRLHQDQHGAAFAECMARVQDAESAD